MNKNMKLVEKSLDTINPEWEIFLVASMSENGFEYDTFKKRRGPEAEEDMAALLALVHSATLKDLKEFLPE